VISDARHLAALAAIALRQHALKQTAESRHASATDSLEASKLFEEIAAIRPGDPKVDHTVITALDAWVKPWRNAEQTAKPALDETQAIVLEQEIERLRSYRDHHENRLHPDDEDRSMIGLYQMLIHTLIGLRNARKAG